MVLYINAPSNGSYHRYPVDVYSFYPDFGISISKWIEHLGKVVYLLESFIQYQIEDEWNDFVAIFSKSNNVIPNPIYKDLLVRNVYENGIFLENTFEDKTEDQLLMESRENLILELNVQIQSLKNHGTDFIF